jgi:polysaccharide export outer membrane protein
LNALRIFLRCLSREEPDSGNRMQNSYLLISVMRNTLLFLLTAIIASSFYAQQPSGTKRAGGGATSLNASSNLPLDRLGKDDLIGITVYDSPELTRTVRVESDGEIRLPMLQQHIQVAGLYPGDLEKAIQSALVNEKILVDPIVTVSVVEYRSRPIYVVGAVRTPVTFQVSGTMTLLDAISQAGGLTPEAGGEILVSQQQLAADGILSSQVQRIPVHGLFDEVDPSLNLKLLGGEVIRVPEAGRVYVVGNVNKPGVFPITDGSESSVLKVLALSGGLEHYTRHMAYVYRTQDAKGPRQEIPIELKKIMDRKSPDVPLLADDILYIPEATGRKNTLTALNRVALVGVGLSADLLILYR